MPLERRLSAARTGTHDVRLALGRIRIHIE